MEISIYQVDAFTAETFGGNPAAVCPLESWLDERLMQSIAAENNLSETAFAVKSEKGGFDLRWFTPTSEVDLCGHATLATAFVLFVELGNTGDPEPGMFVFNTKSGQLIVSRMGNYLRMDFPARPGKLVAGPSILGEALGAEPQEVYDAGRDYLAVFDHEGDVQRIQPDMKALMSLGKKSVIVTAPGLDSDFVSRFFAPAMGIPEDPVTGSSHCTLVPYWAKRLGKERLFSRQISSRGGELVCEHFGDRVAMSGRCALYMRGKIVVE